MNTTQIDNDIRIFLTASIEKEQIEPEDIQRLLDALRIKYNADAAYIMECKDNNGDFFYSYISCDERLASHPLAECTSGSILNYDFIRGNICDGFLVLKTYYERNWTDEEADAVKKVGHVLRNHIINERLLRTDISKRQKNQDTLERALFNGLNKLFLDTYYVNYATNICQAVSANCEEKFTDLLIGSYDQILKNYVENDVHETDRETFARLASRSYAREHLDEKHSHYSFTYRRLTGNGYKWYHVYFILSSLGEDGKVENVIITFCDVNEQKQREIEYKGRLEQTNRNLTASLEQESRYKSALKDAYDASVKANEAKSFFISNMSHDIRTPMNGIIGMTAIAAEHTDDPKKIAECLHKIDVSSKYLLGLINDVLDMSKIESGKVNLTEKDTFLPDFVHSVVTLLQLAAKERGHDFTVNMHDISHEYLTCDTLHLHQIFVNIIGNAIKYTPNGGCVIFEVTELDSTNPKYANMKFVVSDNGIGISEEFLPHLFDPFAQEYTGARSESKGSGLGMAITYNLVTMLGGKIDVQSTKGKGSVFTIYMPLKITQQAKQVKKEKYSKTLSAAPAVPNYALLSGKHFLLAEDNELNIEIMTELMEDKHVTLETAKNGEEAIDLFIRNDPGHFDAILMDIQMPVMNGYEATAKIRNSGHADAENIPIIALSADAFSESAQKALASGMNAHIAKPINFSELCKVLNNIINFHKI